jgi:hypothetical protein
VSERRKEIKTEIAIEKGKDDDYMLFASLNAGQCPLIWARGRRRRLKYFPHGCADASEREREHNFDKVMAILPCNTI